MDKKKVVSSLVTIGATAALLIGATFAYFSDQGKSENNIFSVGTLNLKLSDDNETNADDVTASFGGTDLAPGDCVPSATTSAQLLVRNSGTVAGDHIEISVVNNVTDVPPTAGQALDKQLILDLFTYDGSTDIAAALTDANGNGVKDLDDLEQVGVDNLPLANLNTGHTIALRVCLSSGAGNGVQGDSVDSDWTVTLNQHPSQ